MSASSDVHCNYAAHVVGACDAWKDAETITPDQRAVIAEVLAMVQPRADDLRAKATIAEQAEEVTTKARARFGVRDVVLNRRVNAASDGLLNGPAQRNRANKQYRTIFLEGTACGITRAKRRDKPELAGQVRQNLAGGPEFPARAGLLADLGEAVTKSTEARNALDTAEGAEGTAGNVEMMARLALRETLEKAYGKLRTAFPGERDFVESFFPKRPSSPKPSQAKKGEPKAPGEKRLDAEKKAEEPKEA
jgi:hypothetical protein